MINLGKVKPGSTIRIPWGSFAAATGAPSAVTNYADADIQVYKDGGTTQRASAAGITATTTFDTLTGVNLITIDLSDNTTADFWAAGSEYFVVVSDVTVDSQTLRFPIARFTIGIDSEILATTIATLASQTSFTLTAGSADNSAYVGCVAYIHDAASAVQCCLGTISAYTGSTKTVTLAADPGIFTIAAKDNICILPRTNVYSIAGTAQTARDIGASVLLSAGTGTGQLDFTSGVVKANATQFAGQTITCSGGVTVPAATLASTTNITAGTVTTATNVTTVNNLAAGVITAASIAADAITAAKVASDVGTEIAGAIWTEALPGLYGAGTAGKIVGDNLNATVSSRLPTASYTAPLDAAGTRAAVGLASANLDTQLTAIDDYLDTEVAAIKAKTDQLTFTTANQVDATTVTVSTGAIGTGDIAAAALNEIADAILDRNMATGTDSGSTTVRTPRQAMRVMRNKVAISAGTATIYKEDDATASWTAAVTTTAGDPISAVDPAGP